MKVGKLIGWVLLACAFGFAAAETAAQGMAKQYGIMSAYTVLHTLIPGELIQTKIIIQKNLHPLLWDPIIRAILWLPGWLTFGLPGIFLAWKYRERRDASAELDDDFPISTYDDIVAAAEELDEHMDLEEDNAPSKYEHLSDFNPAAEPDEEGGPEELPGNELGKFKLDSKNLKN